MANREAQNKPHVIMLYKALIPSVILCGHAQMLSLARRGFLEYRHARSDDVSARSLCRADVVILGRLDNAFELSLAKKLHAAGKTLVYMLDDDLLHVPENFGSGSYYALQETQDAIRGMMALSDAILSPSPLLLEKYAVKKKGILTEEPSLNAVPYRRHTEGEPLKIGFAGSTDRGSDLEHILGETLRKIKEKYGNRVHFEFFGSIPSFAGDLHAAVIPYCDSYTAYRERLNACAWDIGLAPLPATAFHACKHYNKLIEYAAAGCMGVFSDVEPYRRIKHLPQAGVFCENTTDAWFRALCEMIENNEKREAIRQTVCRYARELWSTDDIADTLWRDLSRLPVREKQNNSLSIFLQSNIVHRTARRVGGSIRRNGLRGTAFKAWKRWKEARRR